MLLGAVGVCSYVSYKGYRMGYEVAEQSEKVKELRKKGEESYEYVIPPKGKISKEQINTFFSVRRELKPVWKRKRAKLKSLQKEKVPEDAGLIEAFQAGFQETLKTMELLLNLMSKHARILLNHEMSFREYAYLTDLVYNQWYRSQNEEYPVATIDGEFPEVTPRASEMLRERRKTVELLSFPGMDRILLIEPGNIDDRVEPGEIFAEEQ